MTKHTGRDLVWDQALRRAEDEESFKLAEIEQSKEVKVSKRTIRDVLNTLVDLGWLAKETSQAQKWSPGPLANGKIPEDDGSTDSEVDNVESVADYTAVSELAEGEVYFGTVDRITGGGNAIVSLPGDSHINLGPIDPSSEEETVRFEYAGGVWGKCIESEYVTADYSPRDGQSSSSSKSRGTSRKRKRSRRSSSKNTGPDDPRNKNKLLKGKL